MSAQLTPSAALRQDFAPLFVGNQQRISPIHALLNLYEDPLATTALFRTVQEVLRPIPHLTSKVHALIQDSNWRENLVAVGAIFVSPSLHDPHTLSLAWQCFDRGSWVTPQWAALLSILDPRFLQQARQRLLFSRMILGIGAREIGPFGEEDGEAHPTADLRLGSKSTADLRLGSKSTADLRLGSKSTADLRLGSKSTADLRLGSKSTADLRLGSKSTADLRLGSKSIAALFRLYQAHPHADLALLSRLEQTPLPAFLLEESLIDNGGMLAQNWVRRATAASPLLS
ncbi:hypothetical protein L6R29_02805 [Myxococcota bacterium]|nr:hypothetical protein [Myxococcota bacterium]